MPQLRISGSPIGGAVVLQEQQIPQTRNESCQVDYGDIRAKTVNDIGNWIRKYGFSAKGNKLCEKSKTFVARIFSATKDLSEALSSVVNLPDPVIMTSCFLGIHKKSIVKYCTQDSLFRRPLPPCSLMKPLPQSRKQSAARLTSKIDGFFKDMIMWKIHRLYKSGTRVSVTELNKYMKENLDGQADWPYSDQQLTKILYGMGFKYQAIKDRIKIYERKELTDWRARYLHEIKQRRNDNQYLVYLDETWIFQGQGTKRTWINTNAIKDPNAYIRKGWKPLPDPPATKGIRSIVIGAISEEGMIADSFKTVYSGGDITDGDYHKEMNSDLFENWFTNLCSNLPKHANGRKICVIMDNASYHSRKLKSVPTKSSRKGVIFDYLEENGVPISKDWDKSRLLRELEAFVTFSGGRKALTVYSVEEIGKAAGIDVLRLPPYHCMLNPIEHVWSWMKQKLNDFANPTTTRLEALCLKSEEIVYSMPDHMKQSFFNNAIHVEDKFIEDDRLGRTITMDLEKIVIDLTEEEEDPDDFFDVAQFMDGDLNVEEEYEEESNERQLEREREEAEEELTLQSIQSSSKARY